MSRVEVLNDARREWSVAFREFVQIHKSKPHCLFCFFEGEDVKYYGFRIAENLSADIEWEGINCGGKQVVLAIYHLFKEHENLSYQQAQKAFFVDKDFDEPLAKDVRQAIYETPCYSIENFYTTLECFKNILKYEFKISEFSEEDKSLFQQCLNFFEETQSAFHEAMIEFNAWVRLVRKNKIKVNINNYSIDQLVKIEINGVVEKCYTLADLPESSKISTEIDEISRLFTNYHYEFRGKQELQFFIKFLIKLKDDLCCTQPKYFNNTRKISFQIPTSNYLSALTHYAYTPECLRNYLATFQK